MYFCWFYLLCRNQAGEQDVQLMNDRQVVAHYTDPKKAHRGKPVDQGMSISVMNVY